MIEDAATLWSNKNGGDPIVSTGHTGHHPLHYVRNYQGGDIPQMINTSSLLLESIFIILGNADFLTIMTVFLLVSMIPAAIVYSWKFVAQKLEGSI